MQKNALLDSHAKLSRLVERGAVSDFSLIGAMALAVYASPRATGDIDYAIRPVAALADIAKELSGEARVGDIFDPIAGSITFSSPCAPDVPIQCVRFHRALEDVAFENVTELPFQGATLRIVSPSALLLLKLYAGGALDMADARRIFQAGSFTGDQLVTLQKRAKALRMTSRLNAVIRDSGPS